MESWLLFLFHGTEIRFLLSSLEGFGTEFRELASIFVPLNGIPSCYLFCGRVHGTAGIPSEITICSVYSVFRGIIFLSEIPNPRTSDQQVHFLSREVFQQNGR
jgi:hypothetical protein